MTLTLRIFLAVCSCVFWPLAAGALPQGTIAPATVQEILGALGPDAEGLSIPADKIPDIFALTASRLDEDAKNFIVQGSYSNGRWKGGKAIIEYARDLSYTQVSVYDKKGNRQRIYSVASRSSQPATPSSQKSAPSSGGNSSESAEGTSVGEVPISDNTSDQDETATPSPQDESEPAASSPKKRSHHKTAVVASAKKRRSSRSTEVASASMAGFIWDDTQGTYVPVRTGGALGSAVVEDTTARPSRSTSNATSSGSEGADSAAVMSKATRGSKKSASAGKRPVSESTPSSQANGKPNDNWVPDRLNRSSASPSTPKGPPTENATSSTGSGYVWDDAAGAYVPSKSSSAGASASNASSSSTKKSKGKKKKGSEEPAAPALATASKDTALPPTSGSDEGAVSDAGSDSEFTLHSKPVESENGIPSTEDLLSQQSPRSGSQEAPPPNSDSKAGKRHKGAESTPAATTPAATTGHESAGGGEMTATGEPTGTSSPGPDSTGADQWTPKSVVIPKQASDTSGEVASSASEPTPSKRKRNPGDDLAPAENGVEGTGIDSWSPKKGSPAPVVDETQAPPMQVAMAPKPTSAAPPSIDSLLKIAAAGQNSVPNAGDNWAPKSAVLPKPDVDINAELAKLKNETKPTPPPVVVKIKRDINNPEEGVLPVNSFEKFSGPRYGRHWEYERRLRLEKRPNAPVNDYDFFVDEVDRKKEIHNVYYYKHANGNPVPKLIAVEKHDHVTFLSNYDVDQESKGKVSKFK